ncbi:MAG: hypothetical protein NXI31_17445, partial [bacterium]|nr:hypothetical protein [bacterium]
FSIDLSGHGRRDGSDTIEVVVDERVGHNTQGFLPVIQPHFGGIWQSVTLCLDDGPVFDQSRIFAFGRHREIVYGNARGQLIVAAAVYGDDQGLKVRARLGTPSRPELSLTAGEPAEFEVTDAEPWSPATPTLYDLDLELVDAAGQVRDRVRRRVGFRALSAWNTKVHWNGSPLALRGVLHWGYSPPHLAPPCRRDYWRRQILDFQSLGFNCIKCCLWVPPRCFYELCDELGMLVWQEYPTWHAKLDQDHKAELLAEYEEFFAHDRSHPSVAFRSITCETGHGADLDVVKTLFAACKRAVPDTLVVDDSSWIGWQRITDFWDEHPYGNNRWFTRRLAHFRKHFETAGAKPLLLGECMAADTWSDQTAFMKAHGEPTADTWWQPWCWQSQQPVEAWLRQEFGQATVDSLLPISRDFGLRNRKFQIEQLRRGIPEAGYVVSVARDFGKARMGLYDDQGHLKWRPDEWGWHRDTMILLDRDGPWRTIAPPAVFVDRLRVSHFGGGELRGTLKVTVTGMPATTPPAESVVAKAPVMADPGGVSDPVQFELPAFELPDTPRPVTLRAELTGSHSAANEWRFWHLPNSAGEFGDAVVATHLSLELLERIEAGAKVLLLAGDRPGSIRTQPLWYLKGAPFAPPHPIHERLPAQMLLDLTAFDFEHGRVMPWESWRNEVDPILAFWETHDIRETRLHLLAFDTRIGKGRLMATTMLVPKRAPGLDLGGAAPYLEHAMRHHLSFGPPPKRALSPASLAALRGKLTAKKLDLPRWRFRMDPNDEGRAASWHDPATDVTTAAWRTLRAGSHWESQGDDLQHFTGIGWYRVDFDITDDWHDLPARAVFEGVDDSFEVWLDGDFLGQFGDPLKKITIWLEQQVQELGPLATGRHTLVLRVVDHAGAGGLWKPVWLTTGPTGARSRLLH